MPANLTPQYLQAEKEYRQAKTREEKIVCLENMLALIPKHKGTEKLQADIKRRLAKLRRERERTGRARRAPIFKVEREGCGQVVLLGAPNAGKSRLLTSLTNADSPAADYPFTTKVPRPGMVPFEDVQIQLVDTPPVTAEYLETWLPDIVRRADAALIVADLGDEGVLDGVEAVLRRMEAVKVSLVGEIPPDAHEQPRTFRRTAIVANKLDLSGSRDRLAILQEFFGGRFEIWPVSAATGEGLDLLPGRLFRFLRVIRVYTKEPGKKPDLHQPYTVQEGCTLIRLATKVHKDFERTLKYARLWGSGKYDGIRVSRDHVLRDRDIVELHE